MPVPLVASVPQSMVPSSSTVEPVRASIVPPKLLLVLTVVSVPPPLASRILVLFSSEPMILKGFVVELALITVWFVAVRSVEPIDPAPSIVLWFVSTLPT